MSYTFNAKETDKNLVEGKCACGNELSNPEHDRCLDCWKKARSGANTGQRTGFNGNNNRAAVGQSINLAHDWFIFKGIDPLENEEEFKKRVGKYKVLTNEIQRDYDI